MDGSCSGSFGKFRAEARFSHPFPNDKTERTRDVTEEIKRELCGRMSAKLLVLRTMLRLSQADLAKMIGVSRQTVIAMETNKRPIAWNTFLALILVFSKNKSTDQLLKLYEIYTDELEQHLFVKEEGDALSVPELIKP